MEQVAIEPKKSSGALKWVLIITVVCLLVCSGLVAGIFSLATGMMKSAGPYQDAVAQVSANPEVQERLGTPIEVGLVPQGNLHTNGDGSGTAAMALPISGPKGSGVVDVRATRSGGKWEIETLIVRVEKTGEVIDVGAPRQAEAP